ncbi:glycosyltransferase family 4 protein [Luteimonas sp. FXH3W]|uniref:Glycosyltransferase family 4 protein n=1 Tax=Aquilutibacter rugosus TaxID=3115820 RepID=A0ABU7UXM4_9GAMM
MKRALQSLVGKLVTRALAWTQRQLDSSRRQRLMVLTSRGKRNGVQKVPTWLPELMPDVASLEPRLSSKNFEVGALKEYVIPAKSKIGDAFVHLSDRLTNVRKPEAMIFCPWISIGGSDEASLQLISMLCKRMRVLLVLTEKDRNVWLTRVPAGVEVMDISDVLAELSASDVSQLIARLVCEIKPKVMHIINSDAAWSSIASHGAAVAKESAIYASLFCDEVSPDGERFGYARWYLRDTHDKLAAIFVDNMQFPETWSEQLGIPLSKFQYLPLYVDPILKGFSRDVIRRDRVLWVGRNSRQKQPEILVEIARRMPGIEFDMYGIDSLEDLETSTPSNLFFKGYEVEFSRIEMQRYDVFLNTSLWDGLPFVLKQVGASGLPIVSTAVGGISTLLDEDSAFLVRDPTSADEIISMINKSLSAPHLTLERAKNCYNRLALGHTRAVAEEVLETVGYFGG